MLDWISDFKGIKLCFLFHRMMFLFKKLKARIRKNNKSPTFVFERLYFYQIFTNCVSNIVNLNTSMPDAIKDKLSIELISPILFLLLSTWGADVFLIYNTLIIIQKHTITCKLEGLVMHFMIFLIFNLNLFYTKTMKCHF